MKELECTETEYMRLKRQKFCVDDFDLLMVIRRGAFGEVLYVYIFDVHYVCSLAFVSPNYLPFLFCSCINILAANLLVGSELNLGYTVEILMPL